MICDNFPCKFCGPNIEDRFCGIIRIKSGVTLEDLCFQSTDLDFRLSNKELLHNYFTYMPDWTRYKLTKFGKIKKIEKI